MASSGGQETALRFALVRNVGCVAAMGRAERGEGAVTGGGGVLLEGSRGLEHLYSVVIHPNVYNGGFSTFINRTNSSNTIPCHTQQHSGCQ